jgi:hypothetical protein
VAVAGAYHAAADSGATILTLDERAVPTYRACGAAYEFIG